MYMNVYKAEQQRILPFCKFVSLAEFTRVTLHFNESDSEDGNENLYSRYPTVSSPLH